MKGLPLLAVTALIAACGETHTILLSNRSDDTGDHAWVDYLRGDTVQLYAREGINEGSPSGTPARDDASSPARSRRRA